MSERQIRMPWRRLYRFVITRAAISEPLQERVTRSWELAKRFRHGQDQTVGTSGNSDPTFANATRPRLGSSTVAALATSIALGAGARMAKCDHCRLVPWQFRQSPSRSCERPLIMGVLPWRHQDRLQRSGWRDRVSRSVGRFLIRQVEIAFGRRSSPAARKPAA